MARPKKIKFEDRVITDTLTVVEEVEPVAEVPKPEPANPIISVIALGSFHDGAFKHDFEKLGYKVHWKDREVRDIPAQLYAKLMRRSGGKFALKGTR